MPTEEELAGINLTDHGKQGFELSGGAPSLRALADAVETTMNVRVRSATGEGTIRVGTLGGCVIMRHRRSKVLIFGAREHLRTLAATIRFVADGPATPSSVRFHAHVEWYAGHPWLDPNTEFAVISLET